MVWKLPCVLFSGFKRGIMIDFRTPNKLEIVTVLKDKYEIEMCTLSAGTIKYRPTTQSKLSHSLIKSLVVSPVAEEFLLHVSLYVPRNQLYKKKLGRGCV